MATSWSRVGLGLLGAAIALVAVLWIVDRSRPWKRPRLEAATFVTLREGSAGASANARETWLIPINPGCPSCLTRARMVLASRPTRGLGPRLVLLVVDRRRFPSLAPLAELDADAVWWDTRGVWRGECGHRLYGEILRFDARGAYRGTSPPRDPESQTTPRTSEGGDGG